MDELLVVMLVKMLMDEMLAMMMDEMTMFTKLLMTKLMKTLVAMTDDMFTLQQLQLAINGKVVMTEEFQDILHSLFDDKLKAHME